MQDQRLPLTPIARGEGVWLYDFDDRRYLDAISSWWVNLFGHGHPRINAAFETQLDGTRGRRSSRVSTHRPVVEVSSGWPSSPRRHLGHCFYAFDGASATEIALKMSFHYWRNTGSDRRRDSSVSSTAITAKPSGRCLSPTLHSFGTPTHHCCARRTSCPRRTGASRLRERRRPSTRLPAPPRSKSACGSSIMRPPRSSSRWSSALPAWACTIPNTCAKRACSAIATASTRSQMKSRSGSGGPERCSRASRRASFPTSSVCRKASPAGYLPLSVVLTTPGIYDAFYADEIAAGFLHSQLVHREPARLQRRVLATLYTVSSSVTV